MNPYNDDPQRYSLDGVAEPDPGGDYILWSDAEQMLDRIEELERLSLDGDASRSSPCSRPSILRCDSCGKFHVETPDFVICDCGRVAVRMEWATEDELRRYFSENA